MPLAEEGGRMLSEFIEKNRDEIVARSRARVAVRSAPRPTDTELNEGFLCS